MTLKTSFFNKAIYKSCIKRYAWGSVLYFAVLFIIMCLMLSVHLTNVDLYTMSSYYQKDSIILNNEYIYFPLFFTIIVPSVVSLLIFRSIHSKKQSVFIHSLPLNRTSNYISSLSAAFTLMLAPIIATGLILIFMSVGAYSDYFSVSDCFIWMGYNSLGIFLMFSCAVFSANITGNSFACAGINILIHVFLYIIAGGFLIIGNKFLYGLGETYAVYDFISKNNFVYIIMNIADEYTEIAGWLDILKFVLASLVLYVLSYFLYKKRKLETASDVAGFKCLNSVFKYLITFFAFVLGFTMFSDLLDDALSVFVVLVGIISLIAYFASEMILKKTLKVFGSWKGYIGFAFAVCAVILVFAYTSFFGFETRVPEADDISEATIYNYYYYSEEPFSANREAIEKITQIHKGFVTQDKIPVIKSPNTGYGLERYTNIHIKYKLKNGGLMDRVYLIKEDDCMEILNTMYEIEDYKKSGEFVFIDDSRFIRIYSNYGEKEITDRTGFLNAMRQDILSMSYTELHADDKMHQIKDELAASYMETDDGDGRNYENNIHIPVTENYTNTVNWLKENKYIE